MSALLPFMFVVTHQQVRLESQTYWQTLVALCGWILSGLAKCLAYWPPLVIHGVSVWFCSVCIQSVVFALRAPLVLLGKT